MSNIAVFSHIMHRAENESIFACSYTLIGVREHRRTGAKELRGGQNMHDVNDIARPEKCFPYKFPKFSKIPVEMFRNIH